MIRVETFADRASLERRANELEQEGFEVKHLAFRAQEAWAVFGKSDAAGGLVSTTGVAELHSDHVIPKAVAVGLAEANGGAGANEVNVTASHPSGAGVASAVRQHIAHVARPPQPGKPNRNRR